MRGTEALAAASRQLSEAGIDGAARDARRLFAFALGIAPERVAVAAPEEILPEVQVRFAAAVAARAARQPLAQITGLREFYGRPFRVTRDTLDPRPETEILVAAALERPFVKMLDLGTGTGCVLLSCLAGMPMAAGTGTDISEAALVVARENAAALHLSRRSRFLCSDWYAEVEGRFDLIVSNPPYIAEAEIADLAPEVRDWEPRWALTPGGDGLDAYRAIASGAGARLMAGGRLLVEIGPTQGSAVAALFAAAGLAGIAIRQDLDERDRVVIAVKPGAAEDLGRL
ncbi:MAG: peptide chain release factor N(5)-glutamine methyltransferase [Rhodobacteraceae bacterium]|nr:peptide chain release factor N(5)-glutamine methyltransferase [Paracoccaceae bacterium]